MKAATSRQPTDQLAVLLSCMGILASSLYIREAVAGTQYLAFLIGVGLGVALLHAAFGFSGGWRRFIRDRDSTAVRAHLLLLGLTTLLFFPLLGQVFPALQVDAALAPAGSSVLVGAFLFGIGMQLGGGCGSGTLYTMGQGQVDMLVTLVFFITGATLGSAHLHWWLALPGLGKISLIQQFGWWPALLLQVMVLALLYALVRYLEVRRTGSARALEWKVPGQLLSGRLIHGQWPLLWGALVLAGLNLATLLVVGHPWSITYAFGLWGAKLWATAGGNPGSWVYWSSGYPAQSLNSSVLADSTSVMNFGIILGSLLAAALAGKYAPAMKLTGIRIFSAVTGGLLLGYGARLGFGCNIGALVGGIASGSLHGWLWLAAGFSGNIAGVYLRIRMHIDKPPGAHT